MPANQVLGSPAVLKQQQFEFDEGGMGLLSKKKLEELVKQIDPDEKLDPDVEEVSSSIIAHHHFSILPSLPPTAVQFLSILAAAPRLVLLFESQC
jgi:hypothetical protein